MLVLVLMTRSMNIVIGTGNNMITYELAKKLKDAGLKTPYARVEQYYPDVNIPTLEELIEACQEGKEGNSINLFITRDGGCEAVKQFRVSGDYIKAIGSTPEEAVANLYLELNKNNE